MKDLILTVKITFLEAAKGSFNFPIKNSIRLSFWLPEDKASTFSEIKVHDKSIDIGKTEITQITIVEREFLRNRLKLGATFKIGTFPYEIATGKIIKIESY